MSDNICYVDAYARNVGSIVRAVEAPTGEGRGSFVLLDRTVFYPGGGGQPADRGEIRAPDGRAWQVVAVRKVDDEIWHELEPGAEPPSPGPAVFTADLDWHRRLRLMRTHTALHALCGVVWRDYGALVTGGNMEPGGGRMDFEFERMSGELVGLIEAAVNDELARDRPVRVGFLAREEAFAIPDLVRTKVNLLPAGHRDDPDHRDRGPRPAGGRRDARRQHPRGRRDPRHRLRVQGPHQQADPDGADGPGLTAPRRWLGLVLAGPPSARQGTGVGPSRHPHDPDTITGPSPANAPELSSVSDRSGRSDA